MNMSLKPAQKNRALIFGFLASLLASTAAQADDIEIYEAIFNAQNAVGNSSTDPNVLFILDNSLSMDDYRLVEEGPYTGGTGPAPYDPNQIYGNGGQLNQNVYLYDTNMAYTGVRITPQQNDCKAATDAFNANPNLPIHQDKLIRWAYYSGPRRYGWSINYVSSNDNKRSYECEDDNGVHGRTNNSRNKYPRVCSVGQGLCTSNSGNAQYQRTQQTVNGANWPYSFFSTERIMVYGNYHEYLLNPPTTGGTPANEANCTSNDQILVDSQTNIEYRCLQKMEIMKRALTNVINGDPDIPDQNGISAVNLGLMRFNYNVGSGASDKHGGTLIDAIEPSADLDDPADPNSITNKEDFVAKLNNIQFEGNTPLSESMYEAYLYFQGGTPKSSEHSSSTSNQATLDSAAVVDGYVGNSVSDETFKTPLTTNQCQGNYVVMLSDGQPTQDGNYNDLIDDIADIDSCGGGDNCLDELAGALKENLGVNTYTIGFDNDITLLKDAAQAGSPNDDAESGDGYFLADDLNSLETVFARILSEIQVIDNDSFIAPAVTVNAFNRLQNRTDIYYAVFEPDLDPRWSGNIKKYKIGSDATILDDHNPRLNAISDETGFFTDESRSVWSDDDDGPNVRLGGFASHLTADRNLLASIDDTTTIKSFGSSVNQSGVVDFANAVLSIDSTGAILGVDQSLVGTIDNIAGSVVSGILGGSSGPNSKTENFIKILLWTLGRDIDEELGGTSDDPNFFAAESIHSTPYVLSYGTSDSDPKDVVFMTSNQGFLHAITGQGQGEAGGMATEVGGSERWAYVPDQSLLKNLGGYYNKALGTGPNSTDHIYGLDGEIAFDVERNSALEITKAHLFLGQRRGGNKYFAVDVTRAYEDTNPVSKLWTVEGGSGDLARLGDTWAKAVVTELTQCVSATCTQSKVLVIGGGYDTDYDDETKDVASLSDDVTGQDTIGNAIYILDITDGSVLWSASNSSANVADSARDLVVPEMDHSFPSAPTVLDIDKDGAIDIIFAVDVAGQVFRFDFEKNAEGTSQTITGGRIANLQESGVNRRFYNPVDAVFLPSTSDGAKARIALVTGSGYRAHPLHAEGQNNRFYILYDQNFLPPVDALGNRNYNYVSSASSANVGPITASELSQVTNNTTLAAGTTHKYGYYVNLLESTQEKVINPTLISDFQVIGVTYTPSSAVVNNNVCSSAAGNSSAYQLNLLTGETSSQTLNKPGISAAPVLVYILETVVDANGVETESLKPIVIIGTEPFKGEDFDLGEVKLGKAEKRAWWEKGRSN